MHVSRRLVGVILITLIAAALTVGWYGPQAGADGFSAGNQEPVASSLDSESETVSFGLAGESSASETIELAAEKRTADDSADTSRVIPSFGHQVRLTAIVQTAHGREAWFNDSYRGAGGKFREGARFSVHPHVYLIRGIHSSSVQLLSNAGQRVELELDQILSGDTTAQVVGLIREAGRRGAIVQIGPDGRKVTVYEGGTFQYRGKTVRLANVGERAATFGLDQLQFDVALGQHLISAPSDAEPEAVTRLSSEQSHALAVSSHTP